MFNFTTHFYNYHIFINNKFAYNNNQLLTEILNFNLDIVQLLDHRDNLKYISYDLIISDHMNEFQVSNYNNTAQQFQSILHELDEIFNQISIAELTLSNKKRNSDKLYDLLNNYAFLWKTLDDEDFKETDSKYDNLSFNYDEKYLNDFYEREDIDYMEHPPSTYKSFSDEYTYADAIIVTSYSPSDLDIDFENEKSVEDIEELNSKIKELRNYYLTFIDDIIRVKHLYTDFIDNYLNVDNKFLDADSLAKKFMQFMETTTTSNDNKHLAFTPVYSKFYHSVIDNNGESILCESYDFQNLGAFLYFDLFRGIRNNYQPKKCESCGKYFLLTSGKYTLFCENISTIDSTKTCREIGSRKKYSDKCKLDPIWKTYKNAYTSHYARYMRKKMTTSEFEKWSAWAIDWRDKAEHDEITFDEYVKEIKK